MKTQNRGRSRIFRKFRRTPSLLDPESYRALFEHHPDAVYLLNPDGKFLAANSRLFEELMMTPDQLYGMLFDPLLDEADLDRVRDEFRAALNGEARSFEARVRNASGEMIQALVTNVPMYRRGRVAGVFGIARNITTQRRTEHALAASEQRYRIVANHIGQVIFESDLMADTAVWAGRGEEILGVNSSDLSTSKFSDCLQYVHQDDRQALLEKFGQPADRRAGDNFEIQFRWIRPDTQACITVVARGIRLIDGRRCYGVIEDVTEEENLNAQLLASEERLRTVVEHTGQVVYERNATNGVQVTVGACNELFGIDCDRFSRFSYVERCCRVHPDDVERVVTEWTGSCHQPGNYEIAYRTLGKEDREHQVIERGVHLADRGVVIATIQDVSGEKRLLAALDERQRELQLMATAFERAEEAILVCDADFRILAANRSLLESLGHEMQTLRGQRPSFYTIADQGPMVVSSLGMASEWAGELMQERASGEVFISRAGVSAVRAENGTIEHYVVNFSDISEERQLEHQVDYLSWHDSLTGLPNRDALMQWIRSTLAVGSEARYGLYLLDFNRFKAVNDSYGHAVGDELIREAVMRLESLTGERDYLARAAGDEFVVILRDVSDAETAERRAYEILSAFARPMDFDGRQIFFSASVGICFAPEQGRDPDELLRKLGVALSAAKQRGRNSYQLYQPRMDIEVRSRVQLEQGLQRAIGQNELELYYQPEVRVSNGEIVALEALARWRSPQLGLVMPDRFVPVAENRGLIGELGKWVLREACSHIRQLRRLGIRVPISVNLAADQFLQSDLVPMFWDTLSEFGLHGGDLGIEITESAAMLQPELTARLLGELKAIGIEAALDDFGTGHSSLAYLRRFPVSYVKLDQSFVRGLPHDRTDKGIVEAVINLAGSLGMGVIAEGVERESQVAALAEAGCEQAQGYYYSTPLSAKESVELLRKRGHLPIPGYRSGRAPL